MKTLTGKKSLLLGGGLLLICLYLLYQSQADLKSVTAVPAVAPKLTASRVTDSLESESYLQLELGKLFPVLKSLNLM